MAPSSPARPRRTAESGSAEGDAEPGSLAGGAQGVRFRPTAWRMVQPPMQNIFRAVQRHFRKKRMERFERDFRITGRTRILDVGGTPFNWSLTSVRPRLVLLNMPRAGEDLADCAWVAADGRCLPFHDRSFDIVFSNSVIEHLPGEESRRQFAGEVARVGRRYYVQTPNRWFPIEPHLLTPFLHLAPKRWQRRLIRFNVWERWMRPTPDQRDFYLRHYLEDIHLLSAKEMRELFPEAEIVRERFLGLTKSLIAVGPREPAPPAARRFS